MIRACWACDMLKITMRTCDTDEVLDWEARERCVGLIMDRLGVSRDDVVWTMVMDDTLKRCHWGLAFHNRTPMDGMAPGMPIARLANDVVSRVLDDMNAILKSDAHGLGYTRRRCLGHMARPPGPPPPPPPPPPPELSEQERHERLSRVMDEQELWWTTGRNGISPSGFSGPGWLLPHKLQIMEDLLSRARPQPTDITRQDAPLEEEPAPGDERVPGDAVTEDF